MDDANKMAVTGFAGAPHAPQKQERSRTTRRELVDAARRIFARDGFDLARLEDIAAAAGKTRGAFYAHFEDKEDLFFAIFEEDMANDGKNISSALTAGSSRADRIDVLTDLLVDLVKDRGRMLLSIEFKLYAIRQPESARHKRVADLYAAMKMRCAETHIDALLPEFRHKDPARKREQAAEFGALLDGLALNRLFDPVALPESELRARIRAGVEAAIRYQPQPALA